MKCDVHPLQKIPAKKNRIGGMGLQVLAHPDLGTDRPIEGIYASLDFVDSAICKPSLGLTLPPKTQSVQASMIHGSWAVTDHELHLALGNLPKVEADVAHKDYRWVKNTSNSCDREEGIARCAKRRRLALEADEILPANGTLPVSAHHGYRDVSARNPPRLDSGTISSRKMCNYVSSAKHATEDHDEDSASVIDKLSAQRISHSMYMKLESDASPIETSCAILFGTERCPQRQSILADTCNIETRSYQAPLSVKDIVLSESQCTIKARNARADARSGQGRETISSTGLDSGKWRKLDPNLPIHSIEGSWDDVNPASDKSELRRLRKLPGITLYGDGFLARDERSSSNAHTSMNPPKGSTAEFSRFSKSAPRIVTGTSGPGEMPHNNPLAILRELVTTLSHPSQRSTIGTFVSTLAEPSSRPEVPAAIRRNLNAIASRLGSDKGFFTSVVVYIMEQLEGNEFQSSTNIDALANASAHLSAGSSVGAVGATSHNSASETTSNIAQQRQNVPSLNQAVLGEEFHQNQENHDNASNRNHLQQSQLGFHDRNSRQSPQIEATSTFAGEGGQPHQVQPLSYASNHEQFQQPESSALASIDGQYQPSLATYSHSFTGGFSPQSEVDFSHADNSGPNPQVQGQQNFQTQATINHALGGSRIFSNSNESFVSQSSFEPFDGMSNEHFAELMNDQGNWIEFMADQIANNAFSPDFMAQFSNDATLSELENNTTGPAIQLENDDSGPASYSIISSNITNDESSHENLLNGRGDDGLPGSQPSHPFDLSKESSDEDEEDDQNIVLEEILLRRRDLTGAKPHQLRKWYKRLETRLEVSLRQHKKTIKERDYYKERFTSVDKLLKQVAADKHTSKRRRTTPGGTPRPHTTRTANRVGNPNTMRTPTQGARFDMRTTPTQGPRPNMLYTHNQGAMHNVVSTSNQALRSNLILPRSRAGFSMMANHQSVAQSNLTYTPSRATQRGREHDPLRSGDARVAMQQAMRGYTPTSPETPTRQPSQAAEVAGSVKPGDRASRDLIRDLFGSDE